MSTYPMLINQTEKISMQQQKATKTQPFDESASRIWAFAAKPPRLITDAPCTKARPRN